eukprot:TRINITY_DN7572_c0_g1_i2.p1 TRINITY_DN7572_c0_g1~~TRINITY_DN7572_c0_g1_i2.p1  ORF type:complete len:519 (-),score=152.10 TRINITY_DN7572_c0_g1_i2:312-1826(-)
MAAQGSSDIAVEVLDFINSSWTPFHAVFEAKQRLLAAGYKQLSEREPWILTPGGKYLFSRNHSTLVAFAIGKKFTPGNGFWVIGAHTDSPGLRLKPVSKLSKADFLLVDVQLYGGGLWHTWFDRDLSVAGRVIVKNQQQEETKAEGGATQQQYSHRLVKIARPILRVPSLAIHLDREVNSAGFKFNTQTHLGPVLATAVKAELLKPSSDTSETAAAAAGKDKDQQQESNSKLDKGPPHHSLLLELLAEELGCQVEDIREVELCVCDTQPGTLAGAHREFLFVGRLDNLCMSFCSLKALIASTEADGALEAEEGVRVVALYDHEEVGSDSAQGAGSPLLGDLITRVTLSLADANSLPHTGLVERAVQKSFLVSADMAHCWHPNYPEKHEENHQPRMHKGLVIKTNANQRYATNAVTSFLFREIANRNGIPTQDFVVRNDIGCGSTIGPIIASGLGIRTVDVGAPQLSMHSIREMMGRDDVGHAFTHFVAFFTEFSSNDNQIVVDA